MQGVCILSLALALIVGAFFFAVWLIEYRVKHIDESISSMKEVIDSLKNKDGNCD